MHRALTTWLLIAVLLFGVASCSGGTAENNAPQSASDTLDSSDQQSSNSVATPDVSQTVDGEPDSGSMTDSESDGTANSDNGSKAYLTEQSLTASVTILASDEFAGRKPGSAGWKKAQDFLLKRMSDCGLKPAGTNGYKQPITTGTGVNLLGIINGTDPKLTERVVVISAHYDHLGECGGKVCNGALDNAAGVTAVLGAACALVSTPPARSVLVALWDAEEPPTFLSHRMGSVFFAFKPTIPIDKIDAVLVLDLIGGNLWGDYKGHFVMGAEFSPELAAAFESTTPPDGLSPYRIGLHLVEELLTGTHQPWSDYDEFRKRKIPFLFISDGQNKFYHTPQDEVGNLDLVKLAAETLFLHRLVTQLANASSNPTFVENGTDFLTEVNSLIAMGKDATKPGGIVDSLGLTKLSQSKLESDLAAVEKLKVILDAGGMLSNSQILLLRRQVQRLICLAGRSYSETVCTSF